MHFPDPDVKSSWDATRSTVHNLKVRLAVTKVMEKDGKQSRVALAQVHKTSEDGILVYLDGAAGKLKWKQDSQVQSGSLGDYTLGTYVNVGLSVRDGMCTIYVDDEPMAEGKLTGPSARTCYFKTGCYNQDSSRDGYPAEAVNEVRVAAVKVQHDVPWASGGYDPVGPGVGTGKTGEQGNPPIEGPQTHGDKPSKLIQFAGPDQAWKLNLDVDDAGDHGGEAGSVEISAKDLAEGFAHPGHFEVVEDGTAVRFRSHLNGALTGHTGYPRTELREMKPGSPSELEAWDIKSADDTVHRLTAQVKVTHAPSTPDHQGVVIGQIHDTGPHGEGGKDILEIIYDGKKKALGYRWLGPTQNERLIDHYEPGEGWFTYRVEVRSGTVKIAVDTGNGFEVKVTRTGVSEKNCYFKAGAYTQSSTSKQPHTAKPDDYGEALFRSINVETEPAP
jgi:hypothetical protein